MPSVYQLNNNAKVYVESIRELNKLKQTLENIDVKSVSTPEDIVNASRIKDSIKDAERRINNSKAYLLMHLPLNKTIYFANVDKHITKVKGLNIAPVYYYQLEVK